MIAPTERQRQVLALVREGKTLREMCDALSLNSPRGLADHVVRLAAKGLVRDTGATRTHHRYTLTDDGLAALGLRRCGACCGDGVVSMDFAAARTAGRSVARAGLVTGGRR